MEKKNLNQYAILLLLAFIVILGLLNFCKTSNLGKAQKSLKSAVENLDSSMLLINDQKLIIEDIRNSNNKLLDDIGKMELNYDQIKGVLNSNLKNLNNSIVKFNDRLNLLTSDTLDIK
jgi:hypothetical protein